ncbi:HTTM domain-containing protein [Halosegnis rubeus]|uniref:HTTM domain-containing protein n=1 Tax=Halosegnis rubeus TaxID=2212850 RepID=UPI001562B7A1|nr:HTTM domain-containing protein [Halosegnis rubeus]
MSLLAPLRETLPARVGIDTRGLAAVRIALGLLVLCDLALRLPDIAAFYTDAGVLPRSLLAEAYPTISQLSLYLLSGSLAWGTFLFGLTALAAVALVVGYRSRLAALVLFVLLLSLHARNLLIANAGNWLLRRLLLWCAFLPIGRRWALDARHVAADRGRAVSIATLGVLVQVVVVYAVNAVLKLRGDRWVEGSAVQYIYQVDSLTVGLGDLVAGTPLLSVGSHAWLALLVCSPLLVLARGHVRTLLVAALAGGHLFMFATLRLGVFPLVSVASLLVFLPPPVWDRVERVTEPLRARLRDPAAALPTPDDWPTVPRPATQTLTAVALAFVLVWSLASIGFLTVPAAPVDPEERRWDMFAPQPKTADSWSVPVGTTTDGQRVDVFRGGEPQFAVADSGATYPNVSWYLYLTSLPDAATLRPGFADYLCDRWDRRHDSRLATVELFHVTQEMYPEPSAPDRRSLGTFDC